MKGSRDSDVQKEFMRRLTQDWLPAFCDDPGRKYPHSGFKSETTRITDADARDFMRALDHGVGFPDARQRFGMRLGRSSEAIFWETDRDIVPRQFSVWTETVITVAAGARLHFEHGWPANLLAMQWKGGAFDLGAFKPSDLVNEYVAVEVKKNSAELKVLLECLSKCSAGDHATCTRKGSKSLNAHNKWIALRDRRPSVFWAIGPYPESRVFEVLQERPGEVRLIASDETKLKFLP